jgi:hypothetical protein
MIQEGGKRRKSKSSKKSSRKSSRRSSRKMSKASRKSSRKSSKKSSRRSRKGSKKSKKSKSSKKSRRAANPQITVRGALVKYVWANLDVKKTAEAKGMHFIGVPAKIVQMAFVEAQKKHPMKESDKQSAPYWEGVKKTAMGLLKDNLQKYAAAIKK